MEIDDISPCIFNLGKRSRWVAILSRLYFDTKSRIKALWKERNC